MSNSVKNPCPDCKEVVKQVELECNKGVCQECHIDLIADRGRD